MFDGFTRSVTAVTSLPVGVMTFRQPSVITGQGEQQGPANDGFPTLLDYSFCTETRLPRSGCVFRDKSVSVVFETAKGAAALRVCTVPKVRPGRVRPLQVLYHLFGVPEKVNIPETQRIIGKL